MGTGFFVWDDDKVLAMDDVMVAHEVNVLNVTELYS